MYFTIFTREDDYSKTIGNLVKEMLCLNSWEHSEENPELVICVGGDGTFLRAVQYYLNKLDEVTFVGLKKGSLGHFFAYESNEMNKMIDDLLNNRYEVSLYPLIKGKIYKDENPIDIIYAVNEIRIENPFKTMICEVSIDENKLEEFRGNGVLVASTLGSTGYNKSLGGAIVDTKLNLLELTEIAPIESVVYRSIKESIILGPERKITLKCAFGDEVIGHDHLLFKAKENFTHVVISFSSKKIKLINRDFVSSIRRSFIINE